jgi:lipopolysaccharide export system permease protein
VILERYILRNYFGPFFFSLSVITFFFIMDFLIRYLEMFVTKGVGFFVVLQTFVLSLGHIFALTIPMAVLPASLMTYGNLAAENEITAMRANGISMYRMMLPTAFIGMVLALGMVYFNNHVLPDSNHRLLNLLIDIRQKKPTVEVKENVFINAFSGYTIYVRHKNDKTGDIRDIQIFRYHEPGTLPTTIIAKEGHLEYLEESHVLRFELHDGEIHEMPEGSDPSTYRRTEFKDYVINITDIDRSLKRSERNYRGDREMSSQMMRDRIEEIRGDIRNVEAKMAKAGEDQARSLLALLNPEVRDSLQAPPSPAGSVNTPNTPQRRTQLRVTGTQPSGRTAASGVGITKKALESQREIRKSYFRQIDRYRVEIHKKYSIPFACVIFVLIGSPLAIRLGRSGMGIAAGVSILVFLVYYVCLIGGEKLADRQYLSPVIAMWSPNLLFGVAAFLIVRKASQEQAATHRRFDLRRLFKKAS